LKILGKTALTTALVGALGLAMSVGAAIPAHAATQTELSGAGSDTIYFLMAGSPNSATKPKAGLDSLFNASSSTVAVKEIPPSNATATGFPASVTIPADNNCPAYTWDSSTGPKTPPNGSSAGITALQNDDAGANPGCLVDFARSSRGLGNASDTPDLESYAFALDAVSWAIIGSGANKNTHAPHNLSVGQLTKIYTCKADGTPKFGNWINVGGKSAAIVKYAPQTGSGTLSFFQTALLGGATVDSGCNAAHLSHRAEENQLSTRCTGNDPTCNSGTEAIPAADLDNLISPFSYAKWKSQGAKAEPDLRNGAVLEAVENLKPSASTINEGTDPDAPHFVGTRYVYNILTQNEPTYAASASYVGINQNNLHNGFLCQDASDKASVASHKKVAAMLKAFGFLPLPDAVQGAGQPSGYCRFDATPV
jgi:phosphate transport system substrate-binding protein